MDLQTGFVRAKCKNFNLLDFKEAALLPLGMFWLQRGKMQEQLHSGEKNPIPSHRLHIIGNLLILHFHPRSSLEARFLFRSEFNFLSSIYTTCSFIETLLVTIKK